MKKGVIISLLVMASALFLTQSVFAGSTLDKVKAEKKLRVGIAPWKNFIQMNPATSQYEGIIAEDLQNFEKETGIKVEIMPTTWDGMIAGLQAGKWDAIMNGLGATAARAKAVAFTEAYGHFCEAALVRKNDKVNSFADLDQPGNVLAVRAGTSAQELWKGKVKHATITGYSDATPGMLDVISGRAKAFMSDSMVNTFRAKERPELKLFIPENTEWFYQAHAVRFEDKDLAEFLNSYIRKAKKQGFYQKLGAKYDMPSSWANGPGH